MRPTNAEFGRRLFSSKTAGTGGFTWIGTGLLLLALGLFMGVPTTLTRPWLEFLPLSERVPWASGGLAIVSLCLGIRRLRRSGCAQHYYEGGACSEGGGRRQCLAYADAETVTFVVRTVGNRLERSIAFAGPGGRPELSLWTNLSEEDAGDDGTPTVTAIQNVATRVIQGVTTRLVERVDRGEVVKWTDGLWLDQAGLRLDDPGQGKLVPWNAMDGVKDGSKSGKIEIYAFGGAQPVATARTYDVNALPGFQAFMQLLARAQAPAAAA